MTVAVDRRNVKLIVIHHLGDRLGPCTTEAELKRRSQPAGYDWPAYDFGILANGQVITLRPLTVQGAHCISDRTKYIHEDPQWWNRNSAGVVMANDNQKFVPPVDMIKGLFCFLINFGNQRGFGISGMYPHFQITQTLCPGGSYKKLGLNTGYFDYDLMEKAVENQNLVLKKVVDKIMFKALVIYTYDPDKYAAEYLADHLRAPLVSLNNLTPELSACATTKYKVGGSALAGTKLLSGWDRFLTAEAVLKFIRG